MSNNIIVKPLTFPITLDPFSGYSYGKGDDTIGNSRGCENVIDDENNLNAAVANKTFNHPLDECWKKAAEEKFGETDQNRQDRIDQFYNHLLQLKESNKAGKNIVNSMPTITLYPGNKIHENKTPNSKYNEFLLKFLRAGNHDVNYAGNILINYIKQANTNPKYSKSSTNMQVIRRVYEDQIGALLPHRDQYGRRVYFYRPGKWNPDTVSLEDVFCAGYMLCEVAAREPMSQICGVTVICDASDFGFKQLRQFGIEDIKAFSSFMQDTFPLWFHQIHVINAPRVFQMLFSMAKPFLHQRTTDAIIFHANYDSLYQCVDKEILPTEYGGTAGNFDNKDSSEAVYEMLEFFIQVKKYVEENKI